MGYRSNDDYCKQVTLTYPVSCTIKIDEKYAGFKWYIDFTINEVEVNVGHEIAYCLKVTQKISQNTTISSDEDIEETITFLDQKGRKLNYEKFWCENYVTEIYNIDLVSEKALDKIIIDIRLVNRGSRSREIYGYSDEYTSKLEYDMISHRLTRSFD